MMRAMILALSTLLGGCLAAPPGGYSPPAGFSTYARTDDGKRVRLWTDYATGTTTGTIGGKSVRFKSY